MIHRKISDHQDLTPETNRGIAPGEKRKYNEIAQCRALVRHPPAPRFHRKRQKRQNNGAEKTKTAL